MCSVCCVFEHNCTKDKNGMYFEEFERCSYTNEHNKNMHLSFANSFEPLYEMSIIASVINWFSSFFLFRFFCSSNKLHIITMRFQQMSTYQKWPAQNQNNVYALFQFFCEWIMTTKSMSKNSMSCFGAKYNS